MFYAQSARQGTAALCELSKYRETKKCVCEFLCVYVSECVCVSVCQSVCLSVCVSVYMCCSRKLFGAVFAPGSGDLGPGLPEVDDKGTRQPVQTALECVIVCACAWVCECVLGMRSIGFVNNCKILYDGPPL
jgi:hypothetical protein